MNERILDAMKAVGIECGIHMPAIVGFRNYSATIDMRNKHYGVFDVTGDGDTLEEALILALLRTWKQFMEIEEASEQKKALQAEAACL
jgi:hypothetical protein